MKRRNKIQAIICLLVIVVASSFNLIMNMGNTKNDSTDIYDSKYYFDVGDNSVEINVNSKVFMNTEEIAHLVIEYIERLGGLDWESTTTIEVQYVDMFKSRYNAVEIVGVPKDVSYSTLEALERVVAREGIKSQSIKKDYASFVSYLLIGIATLSLAIIVMGDISAYRRK